MPISKRIRFAVFEAANFTCAYCGRKPPTVTLELDHLEPKCKGGTDARENLLCSCFDCNRGKSGKRLHEGVPSAVTANVAEVKERLTQLKALQRWSAKLKAAREGQENQVAEAFATGWGNSCGLGEAGMRTARTFIDRLGLDDTLDALRVAFAKRDRTPEMVDDNLKVYKYWCGICWRWIREGKQDFRRTR